MRNPGPPLCGSIPDRREAVFVAAADCGLFGFATRLLSGGDEFYVEIQQRIIPYQRLWPSADRVGPQRRRLMLDWHVAAILHNPGLWERRQHLAPPLNGGAHHSSLIRMKALKWHLAKVHLVYLIRGWIILKVSLWCHQQPMQEASVSLLCRIYAHLHSAEAACYHLAASNKDHPWNAILRLPAGWRQPECLADEPSAPKRVKHW